jgi:hypothetical protein
MVTPKTLTLLAGVAVVGVIGGRGVGESRAHPVLVAFESLGMNEQGYPDYRHRQMGIVFVKLYSSGLLGNSQIETRLQWWSVYFNPAGNPSASLFGSRSFRNRLALAVTSVTQRSTAAKTTTRRSPASNHG